MSSFTTPRLARRIATMNLATAVSTPAVTTARPKAAAYTVDWTPGCWSRQDSQSSEDDEKAESGSKVAISVFSDAMDNLNQVATNASRVSPLMFQLKTTWDEASEEENQMCIDKGTEACNLVCDIIAPKAGQELFQSCCRQQKDANYNDLVPLMVAYSNASTKNVKTQILSLYAYRYPVKTLQRIHEPYAKLTEWQISDALELMRERVVQAP